MKKILCALLTLLLIVVGINKINAEYAYDTSRLDSYITIRNEENNFGINKKWMKTDSNTTNIMQTPYVDSSLKIYDFAGILKEEEITNLKTQIDAFKNLSGMDIVILTIDMPYSYDSKNEVVAADFYDYNDFGIDTEKYDGVLFLRNNYSSDRYYNIYTFGKAQLYFDYYRCEYILDHVYPDISTGRYLSGFSTFINDLTNYYNRGKALDKGYDLDENGFVIEVHEYTFPLIPACIIATIVATIAIVIMVKKNKMIKKAYEANDYLDEGSITYRKKSQHLVSSHTTHYTVSSSSGSGYSGGGGGGHSHSGSSGGGHGGGGGRHG